MDWPPVSGHLTGWFPAEWKPAILDVSHDCGPHPSLQRELRKLDVTDMKKGCRMPVTIETLPITEGTSSGGGTESS
ncbi:unnamed protein product [Leuciscus chuanchicus]